MNLLLKYKYVFFVVISFILYGNTISNDYSLDDNFVTENNITTKGLSSVYKIFTTHYDVGEDGKGYEYRPIVKLSYAIEHQFFGVNSHTSHFINILLYSLCLMLLYKVLLIIFSENKSKFVFITVLLFAILPIHTEVVASLKNRDILLCYILSFSSFIQFNLYREKKVITNLCLGIFLLFTAFLSKLDALPLIVVFPFLLLNEKQKKYKNILLVCLFCITTYIGYKFFHNLVLDKNSTKRILSAYENPLYYDKSFLLRISTFLNSFGFYCKMLLLPNNLNCYYGYNTIPVNNFISGYSVFGFVTGIFSLIAVTKYYKTPKHPVFVGVVFFICSISMYLNIIRSVPGIVADRFVFFASTGFAIVLSYCVLKLTEKPDAKKNIENSPIKLNAVLVILSLFCSIAIINRNKDWKNRMSLLESDIRKYPNSVKLNVLFANELISQINKKGNTMPREIILQNINLAKKYLNVANKLDSTYYNINNSLGYIELNFLNNPKSAITYFYKSYTSRHFKFETCLNIGLCYVKLNKTDSAEKYFIKAYTIKPKDESLKNYLYNYYGSINQKNKYFKIYPN